MKLTPFAFAAVLAITAQAAHADEIFVEPATGSNVTAADLGTATELIQSSVAEVSGDQVIDDQDKADFILRPRLIRLGESFVLSLAKVKGTEIVFSSQLKAQRIDELDKVAQRLTRSVLAHERAKSNPQVGEITDQEATDGTQRRPARQERSLSFGAASFGNLNSSGIGYSVGTSYSWDLNRERVKLMGEFDINGSALFLNAGIGGNYYLSMRDVAPYLSADFGVGTAKSAAAGVLGGDWGAGFVLGAGGGVELLRTASVNIDIGIRAAFLLHSNEFGSPIATSLRLGLYF